MYNNTKIIDVDTGELKVSAEPVILQSVALGSCIALTVHEQNLKIGGLAHIMLPGKSPSSNESTKYAEDAITALIDSVEQLGAEAKNLTVGIVGGANILREGDIPEKVIQSVKDNLRKSNLNLNYQRVGGFERRSVFLETSSGRIFYTEGDNTTKVLLNKFE